MFPTHASVGHKNLPQNLDCTTLGVAGNTVIVGTPNVAIASVVPPTI